MAGRKRVFQGAPSPFLFTCMLVFLLPTSSKGTRKHIDRCLLPRSLQKFYIITNPRFFHISFLSILFFLPFSPDEYHFFFFGLDIYLQRWISSPDMSLLIRYKNSNNNHQLTNLFFPVSLLLVRAFVSEFSPPSRSSLPRSISLSLWSCYLWRFLPRYQQYSPFPPTIPSIFLSPIARALEAPRLVHDWTNEGVVSTDFILDHWMAHQTSSQAIPSDCFRTETKRTKNTNYF